MGLLCREQQNDKVFNLIILLKKSNKYDKDSLFLSQIKNTSTCLAYIICQGRGQLC